MSEPSQFNGQVNSVLGSAKQMVGGAIETAYSAAGGSSEPSSWTTTGKKQHAEGEAEITAAQTQNYAEGLVAMRFSMTSGRC